MVKDFKVTGSSHGKIKGISDNFFFTHLIMEDDLICFSNRLDSIDPGFYISDSNDRFSIISYIQIIMILLSAAKIVQNFKYHFKQFENE